MIGGIGFVGKVLEEIVVIEEKRLDEIWIFLFLKMAIFGEI